MLTTKQYGVVVRYRTTRALVCLAELRSYDRPHRHMPLGTARLAWQALRMLARMARSLPLEEVGSVTDQLDCRHGPTRVPQPVGAFGEGPP